MGRELADYAKRAGMKGIMHSDELPAYGIDAEETNRIKNKLQCNNNDAFLLIFGKEKMVENAMNLVIERIKTNGVPAEVRKVTPENFTRYLRPTPGASRMYPETDIAPLKINNIKISKPKFGSFLLCIFDYFGMLDNIVNLLIILKCIHLNYWGK